VGGKAIHKVVILIFGNGLMD